MTSVFSKEQIFRYRRHLVVTVLLATLQCPGLTFAAQQDEADCRARHRLILIWNDPNQLLQMGFDEVSEEVDSVFRELGADIEWKKFSSAVFERSGDEILALLLPEKPGDWMPGKTVMGVVSHSGPPVIRVFFDNVNKTLGLEPLPVRPQSSEERIFYMTRAMARVLAHEIIHAIAPAHPHASDGLMNPRLTRAYLTDDEINLDQRCTDAFVAALRESQSAVGSSR